MEHWKDESCILWTGSSSQTPIVRFRAEAFTGESPLHEVGERCHLSYNMGGGKSRLVRNILSAHGFQEVESSSQYFNVMWTGPFQNQSVLKNLSGFQRINHFPKSGILGQKDLLYKNLRKLQQKQSNQRFDFLPETYVLPTEYQNFSRAILKDRGTWIVKPVASCEGRGIKLIDSLSQISKEDRVVVSKYISNPLLINGFKFDLRLYVLVTSYDPLVIYLYQEGITRFATAKYQLKEKTMSNKFMHLTNYSINKKSSSFVRCHIPNMDDYGSQWTMSAMLRYLKNNGKDTATLMSKIEDLVIKAIISAEGSIALSCKMNLAHKRNCFELYGFDVIIDENLKPWLLEINLSPSLGCDDVLNLKIKSNLMADTLTLVGVECKNPQQKNKAGGITSNNTVGQSKSRQFDEENFQWVNDQEEERRGGFVRIFPTQYTWERYSHLLTFKTMNQALDKYLYGDKPAGHEISKSVQQQHSEQYERKLPPLQQTMMQYQTQTIKSADVSKTCHQSPGKSIPEVGNRRNIARTSLCSEREAVPELGRRKSGNIVGTSFHTSRQVVSVVRGRKPVNYEEKCCRSGSKTVPEVEKRHGNIAQTCHHSGKKAGLDLWSRSPSGTKPKTLDTHIGSAGDKKKPPKMESARTECLWHQNEALLKKRSKEISNICDGFSSFYKQAFSEIKRL
ncbi:tubulin polyglutamylase TTLL5 isoform X3 [Pelobates cultripes]|uniref:Tubulin--tyrosine ligase-like protein 5 n=1 Tax=Pelobates cultripes TaxID=61616 RepID=A0AAD1SMT9_PELCU|nr:tubulin polyglutamylase TTLL5 isoform X3 [Pelobates cultripes]